MNTNQQIKALEDSLKQDGYKRRGYGAFLKKKGSEDLFFGVSFQSRRMPTEDVLFVDAFSIVVWDELEREVCKGWGLNYKTGNSPTWTNFASSGKGYYLTNIRGKNLKEQNEKYVSFSNFVHQTVIKNASQFANKNKLTEYLKSRVEYRDGHPEKLIVLEKIINGKHSAYQKYQELLDNSNYELLKPSLQEFGKRYFN